MNITQIYNYNTCILIRKILNNELHTEITFTKRKRNSNLRPINPDDLNIQPARTKSGSKTLLNEGVKLYNSLPQEIKQINSLPVFKKKLKNYILNNNKKVI